MKSLLPIPRRARIAAVLAIAFGLSLSAVAPAQAAPAVRYIVQVIYYTDATLLVFAGAYTWNNCPGEEGSWGYGLQTPYHVTFSEECP
ncbi:hypothetical protein OG792_20150 [Micromonospora sp. NBC_01699]|uniref:hypothetical protein n=1 Tax=Micromonospora sp. NBC_01699 TaxID=2975984 RepID=UPI002E2C2118|nr:hypothetical protein [Micromonospora sp. NBC_01699]